MKIKNFGTTSLVISLISWTILIVFTLLSWAVIAHIHDGYNSENPRPENFLIDFLPIVASLAFPGSILATIFGIIALIKGDSVVKPIISIFLSIPLFLLLGIGFWIAGHGGV
ncbi:MAG: hypothetical protein PVI90_09000 [Desulfobacteraceae bacterium]|jgi:hypothetical protein